MFQTIKSQVPLLAVIQKDTGLTFKQTGENFVIEDEEEQGGCPFCGHRGCFKVLTTGEDDLNGFFKCFSCDEKGDVIEWRSKLKKLEPGIAAKELATEYSVQLPRDWSPVQHLFSAAAHYYENCLLDPTSFSYAELGGKTPLEYQMTVRGHSEKVLKEMHVGWSDGGLVSYLESVGFDEDTIKESGLRSAKTGKDFFVSKVFIYPQYVKGRVSHFTMKDPVKRLAYQLPKKYSINSWSFYNQDSVKYSDTIIVVEGENDLISCLDTGKVPSIIGTIGQLSGDQMDWMRDNLSTKNILTIFDNDDAGWKYRVKLEKLRKYFRNMAHVVPPDEKDIDDILRGGGDLEEIIKANLVKVDPAMFGKENDKPTGIDVAWGEAATTGVLTPHESFQETLTAGGLSTPTSTRQSQVVELLDENFEEETASENGKVIQKRGAYWRITFKDGQEVLSKIANFTMKMVNMFINEQGGRQREMVITREDGYRSEPFMVDDDTKVKVPSFKILAAKAADAYYVGTDSELSFIWEIARSKAPTSEVTIPQIVGRHEKHGCWIFRNKVITDSGHIIDPDENGIFWMPNRKAGIRPDSLSIEEGGGVNDRSDIPALLTDLTYIEKDTLLKGIIHNVGLNLNSLGKSLTMVGWTHASVYSNFIFEMNRGFPFLFFWGVNGQGKSTVAKWITQDFYGINGHGSTSVPNLRTGVGWARKGEYYASMPLFIDEVRSDEATRQYLGVFRSYYDREARTMGVQKSFGIRNVRPRAVFVFNGEDQFEDPATRERCIPIRIPVKGRELQTSYRWMEENKHLFTGILYHWILGSVQTLNDPDAKEALREEIRALDKELHAAGCSQRTAKNWAAVGVFGMRLARKFFPDYDYKAYLIQASTAESNYQKSDTTLMQFWELVESTRAQEMSHITDKHICREGNVVHVWYSAVFRIIQDESKGKFPFSKNAVMSALREEPYFISENKKVAMGLDGTRRMAVTLDLTLAPDSIKNIALAN